MRYLLVSIFLSLAVASNTFQKNEKVQIIVNKIGPLENPTESYRYHKLSLHIFETLLN